MRLPLMALLLIPSLGFAASDDNAPPKPTETTTSCKGVEVWDAATQKCVKPKGAALDSDVLYGAARELAYAGRYQDAQSVLAEMPDQGSDRVLTYWGFTHRKLGNLELAQMFYEQAIALNPNNILARSYMAQGHVQEGRVDEAIVQWREIKARGGEGTWAEASLREAIRTGLTYNY
ncbi:tetratricopeptide repeat protein [Sedimentitalea nanhaiensis]|uniref:Uncharacterized protein n=1 Tax=Sedimentitalea nanhaiensis TaxID=999627 RepID=A0A1I6ZVK9_9RHOB|nr:hypothetical protein [Sedimentitalea nanhaiensis]SFT66723.1 hypothetical protein SAMN05216236_1059 [Sedimentitalea nanhaiensis]